MSESTPIETSLFDLFECGPGPSSSHTMGPMKAGYDFLRRSAALAGADQVGGAATGSASEDDWRFRVRLFGSLSATGAGHGTDAAVVAGLLGYQPSQCPPGLLKNLAADRHADHAQPLGRHTVRARLDDVVHDRIQHDRPYSNTLVLSLHGGRGETLLEKEYYSVGGGFIQWEGWSEPERGLPVHPYRTMRDLKEILRVSGLTLHCLMLENEIAITGMGRAAILEKLEGLLETVENVVRRVGVKLVCIDNLMTAMDVGVSDNLYQAQSAFVHKLKRLAVKYDVAVVLVAHPRKTKDSFTNDDVSGSGDITNRVDTVLAYSRNAYKNEEDLEDCDSHLAVTKNRMFGKLTKTKEPIELYYSQKSKRITSKSGFADGPKRYGWEQVPVQYTDFEEL